MSKVLSFSAFSYVPMVAVQGALNKQRACCDVLPCLDDVEVCLASPPTRQNEASPAHSGGCDHRRVNRRAPVPSTPRLAGLRPVPSERPVPSAKCRRGWVGSPGVRPMFDSGCGLF